MERLAERLVEHPEECPVWCKSRSSLGCWAGSVVALSGIHGSIWPRCRKKFYTCVPIFNHKSNSNEDIHLAHIEPKIRSLEPLTDERIAIVFQPTARASPAHTKTNRQPHNWCRGGSNFFTQFVPNGCLHWIPGYR